MIAPADFFSHVTTPWIPEMSQSFSPQPFPPKSVQGSKLGQRIFLGFLAVVACCYAVLVGYHVYALNQPKEVPFAREMGFMEECRQICMKYGLLSTGHVENDARAYLEKVGAKTLSTGLTELLHDKQFTPVATMEHPLLMRPAPDFNLLNVEGQSQSLSAIRGHGPAIVIFYYGYGCSHCVAQLFGLNDDLRYFEELGVPIVAISTDAPEHTAEKYKEYGPFGFPVLSDPDNQVAGLYSTYFPATPEKGEDQLHGTFLISAEGQVVWANTGHQPFIDNKSLLFHMAVISGFNPSAESAAQQAGATPKATH